MPDDIQILLRLQAVDQASPTLAKVTGEVQAMQGATAEATTAGAAANGQYAASMSKVEQSSREAGGGLGRLYSAMYSNVGMFALGATAAEGFGLKVALNFDNALAHIQAFTSISDSELSKLKDELLGMSEEFGVSTTKLAEGYYQLASAGIQGTNALIALRSATMAASASQVDAALPINVLVTAIESYRLKGQQIADAQDQITTSLKLGKAEFVDFGPALATVIPTAARLGIQLNTLGALFAEYTLKGQTSAETGVLLNNVFNQMIAPMNQQVMAARALGISWDEVKRRLASNDLLGAFAIIDEHLKRNGVSLQQIEETTGKSGLGAQRLADRLHSVDAQLRTLFGGSTDALKAFDLVMNDSGKQYTQLFAGQQKAAGSTEDAYHKMASHTQHDLDELRAAFERLDIKLQAGYLPIIGQAAHDTAAFLNVVSGGISTLDDFGSKLASIGGQSSLGSGLGRIARATPGLGLALSADDLLNRPGGRGAAESDLGGNTGAISGLGSAAGDALKTVAQTLTQAAKQFDSQQKISTESLKSAESAMASSLISGKGNLEQFRQQAVQDSIDLKQHADALLNAKITVERAAGDFSAALRDSTTRDQTAFDEKRAALVLAIDAGDKNIHQLALSAAEADRPLLSLSRSAKEADKVISELTGQGRAGRPETGGAYLNREQGALQTAVNNALGTLLRDQSRNAPSSRLSADQQAVDAAKRRLDEFNGRLHDATQSAGTLADQLNRTRQHLQTDLENAVARMVLDERHGAPASTIAGDQAQVDRAKSALDSFTRQVNDATAAARRHADAEKRVQDENTKLGHARDEAEARVVLDLEHHSGNLRADEAALRRSEVALDAHTKAVDRAKAMEEKPKPLTASEQQTKDRATLQTAYDNAVALGAADLRAGHAITKAHQDAIDRDKTALDRFNRSITEAEGQNIKAAKATQALVDVLQQIPSAWQAAQQNLARLIVTGQAGQQGRFGGPAGIEPGTMPTKGDIATLGLGRAATSQEGLNLANDQASTAANAAMLTAARSAGDLSRAFDILSQTDTANLSASWKALEEHFLTGDGNLQDLIASYQAAKAAQDQETQANIDALKATGQYAAARTAEQQRNDAAFNDTLAKDIGILEQHGSVSQADIDALIRHRESADADTQANWDLSFAAASAAEQQNMLSQRFSGMVSQAQQRQGDLGRLDQASLSILTAQAAVQTDKLSDLVTETQDQTAIMAAQANVDKARGDGQVTALTDQTAILQASESVWKDTQDLMRATTPQAVAVARQQLAVDQLGVKLQQDKAAADARNAQMQVVLAQDNVTIQKDKAASDTAAAAAKMRQDEDALQTAIDTQKLTEDEVTLDGIMAERLDTLVTSAIPDVKSRYGEIVGALGSIAQDNAAIRADNRQSAMDQIAASQQAQAYALQISQDEQQLAADQASANAQSLAGQLQQGQDAYALEQARFSLQQLQYSAALQANTLLSSTVAAVRSMDAQLKQFVASNAFVSRFGLTGSRGLNQLTVDMHGSVSA